MGEVRSNLLAGSHDVFNGFDVGQIASFFFCFACIHVGHGCTVYHPIGLMLGDYLHYVLSTGDVH